MSSFASGLAAGVNVKQSRRQKQVLEQKRQQKRADDLAASIESSREGALASAKEFENLAVELAGNSNIDLNDPQFQKLQQGHQAVLMGHGSVLAELAKEAEAEGIDPMQLGIFEDPRDFVQREMTKAKSAVDAAFASRVQTLTGDQLPEGIPRDAVVQKKPDGTVSMLFEPAPEGEENESALAERVRLLTQSGVDRERAIAIAAGALKVTQNPITNVTTITDLRDEPVGDPIPAPGFEAEGIIPGGTDVSASVGGAGVFTNTVNILTDAFGAGATFEGAEDATVALNGLNTRTMLQLTGEMPGRPSNLIREELKKLAPQANSIFRGKSRTTKQLQQVKGMVDTEIDRIERALAAGVSPTDHGTMTASKEQLQVLSKDYETLLSSLEQKSQAGADNPRLQAMDAAQAALDAGDIAKARAINDALESGDEDALKKALGDGSDD